MFGAKSSWKTLFVIFLQCLTDISKHTTDHRKTDNHQKNQNHMQEHPHTCNSSKSSSAIGDQTIATLTKKKTSKVLPITAACSSVVPNARPLTPPLPPTSPPSSTFDTTLNIDTFAKTDNSPSSFSSKNNKTSHNTEWLYIFLAILYFLLICLLSQSS